MNVVRIAQFTDTVPEFIRREGRGLPVSTIDISARFGWDMAETRRRLNALVATGEIHRDENGTWEAGRCAYWTVKTSGATE